MGWRGGVYEGGRSFRRGKDFVDVGGAFLERKKSKPFQLPLPAQELLTTNDHHPHQAIITNNLYNNSTTETTTTNNNHHLSTGFTPVPL